MPRFLITLPARGDGRHPLRRNRGDWQPGAHAVLPPVVSDVRRGAFGPFDHLAQVGRAAEIATFGGALAPFDAGGEESLVVAAGLLRQTRWLRVVAEFHPVIATPVYAAKISASLQRFSGDRLDWQVAVDLDRSVARSQGDFVTGANRYVRADEFLTVAKGVWHEEGYSFDGRFYHVLSGGFQPPLSGRPFPRIHLSGTSPEALALSARHADVHVFRPEDDLEAGIAALTRGRATAGLRVPVLARDDDEEAWEAARTLWIRSGGEPEAVPERGPLWTGFGSAGLVGSYETVAQAIRGYLARGVTTFFLEARPHIEETYRLGERLLPLLVKEDEHAR
ncbi:LLM class flavin-dependent oxidoreductase [Streptosporangium soli]|nr:LLM class flavin-dependent oxidoreductase [Streptosporangium sp. KLBMP 9127]